MAPSPTPLRCRPLAEHVILVECGDPGSIDAATHQRVRATLAALRRDPVPGTRDVVPAYNAIAIHLEPTAVSPPAGGWMQAWSREIEVRLAAVDDATLAPGRLVEVPVKYGGADGPDLGHVAAHAGLTEDAVIALHAGTDYHVYLVGFSPGFPYLAGLPERLTTPRRATPRTVVPAGSVAIGGRQTGIYPLSSPGGWHLIGRTSLPLFTPSKEPPTLLQLGDRVRFIPVG
jgi:inhibitor of KinA